MTTDNPKFSRYMWLIPLVMMALAILACDENYIPPPTIDRVETQADAPGRAYVRVVNVDVSHESSTGVARGKVAAYETADYGVTWQPSAHVFADFAKNSFEMNMSGENLLLNGRTIWSFPRPIFRGIFYDGADFSSTKRFTLPYGTVSNRIEHDTLYMAMGTEGVLVGKLDENGLAPDWHLSATGIDALAPLPLTITDPSVILGIVLLILFVPPFALIHAYLLQRVWVYLLPPPQARQMALKVTAGLVVLAIIGSVVWLTNDRIDLYQVIGVLTAITVLVGMVTTVLLAQKIGVTDSTRNRLVLAAFLLSLIVPGGVAAIFAMWWLVFGIVFCYWAYQRAVWRHILTHESAVETRIQRWRVDRLVIEMIVMIALGITATLIGTAVLNRILYNTRENSGMIFLFVLACIIGFYFLIRHYSTQRIYAFDLAFHNETKLSRLPAELRKHTIYWIALALIATIATFIGQAWAYGWFTSLLKANPVP